MQWKGKLTFGSLLSARQAHVLYSNSKIIMTLYKINVGNLLKCSTSKYSVHSPNLCFRILLHAFIYNKFPNITSRVTLKGVFSIPQQMKFFIPASWLSLVLEASGHCLSLLSKILILFNSCAHIHFCIPCSNLLYWPTP